MTPSNEAGPLIDKASVTVPAAGSAGPRPQTFSIVHAWHRIRAERWRILLLSALGLALSVLLVLLLPPTYTSSSSLLPQRQNDGLNLNLGVLRQFSGLLGSSSASSMLGTGDDMPFDLYPEILKSTPLQLALLGTSVRPQSNGGPIPLYRYLGGREEGAEVFTNAALDSTKGAGAFARFDSARPDTTPFLELNRDQEQILKKLSDRVDGRLNIRTGVLTVTVEMPDPIVAAEVSAAAVRLLANYVTQYRSGKKADDVRFIEQRFVEAREVFRDASLAVALFRDRNWNLARDAARVEEQRLQSEYDVAFDLYNSLAMRLEESRIQLQERTPVFQVLEPVARPTTQAYPKPFLTCLIGTVVGLALGILWALLAPDIRELYTRLGSPGVGESTAV